MASNEERFYDLLKEFIMYSNESTKFSALISSHTSDIKEIQLTILSKLEDFENKLLLKAEDFKKISVDIEKNICLLEVYYKEMDKKQDNYTLAIAEFKKIFMPLNVFGLDYNSLKIVVIGLGKFLLIAGGIITAIILLLGFISK